MGYKFIYIISTICLLFIQLLSCSENPTLLLDKAERMWGHKIDSVNMYLSQIENPQHLRGREKMRYCYLKGIIDFYLLGKSADSLFTEAKKEAILLADSQFIKKLMVRDLIRFSYSNSPDSILNTIDEISKSFPAFADSIRFRLLFYHSESLLKKNRYHDVINKVTTIRNSDVKNLSDSLLYIHVILQMMDAYSSLHRYSEADSIYTFIEEYIAGNENLISEVNCVRNRYLSKLEEQKRWSDAIHISTLLDESNKEKTARNMYLKARMYEQAGMQDSAIYFYKIAEQGHLPLIASLASKRLMDYFLSMGYDAEAYKSMQKDKLVENDMANSISSRLSIDEFKRTQLENELYQIRIKRQEQQLLLLVLLLLIAVLIIVYIYYYFRVKRERVITTMKIRQDNMEKEARILKYQNELLRKETEIVVLRESLFRRLSFYNKLPSLENRRDQAEKGKKIILTHDEWQEIKQAVDTSFDKFSVRLEETYPLLTSKDIYFCCLVKLNVNMQDLSDIYCVSKAAISKRKFRIKTEKLKIEDENISLDVFLRDF